MWRYFLCFQGQTLCTPCHKRKTSGEARVRAEQRKRTAEDGVLAEAERALERSNELLKLLGDSS